MPCALQNSVHSIVSWCIAMKMSIEGIYMWLAVQDQPGQNASKTVCQQKS
jgi:hypothetical protein